jgi:hypothetical protein
MFYLPKSPSPSFTIRRTFILIPAFLLLLASVGCKTPTNYTYDKTADFDQYKTFVVGDPMGARELFVYGDKSVIDRQLKQAITDKLTAAGLEFAPEHSQPQLTVLSQWWTTRDTEQNQIVGPIGTPQGDPKMVTRGSLEISIVDNATGKSIYRSWSPWPIKADQLAGAEINNLVEWTLSAYPPKADTQ